MIFLFRINGGQVLGASTDSSAYVGINATFFNTVTDPPQPNGADLSVPKIYDGTNLRNATAQEITAFATAVTTDTNLQARAQAISYLQTNIVLRKAFSGLIDVFISEINLLRTATGLTPPRTKAQAITAIVNAINAGSDD